MKLWRRSNSVTCRQAVELIASYLDGALPRAEASALEAHLQACPHCAQYLHQLRASISATGAVSGDQLSPEARSALMDLYRKTH